MGDHVRKQIRDRVKTLLTGLTTTTSNCYASRVKPLQDAELPAVLVDTLEAGEIRPGSAFGAGRVLERALPLTISVAVKQTDNYQDTLDQIYKEVEIALAGDNTLGGLAKYVQPSSEPAADLSGEGEKPIATGRMTFEVVYLTALNAPDQAL